MSTATINKMEVGTILVATWGYGQTNVTFYQVTKRTPKRVTVVQVPTVHAYDEGGMTAQATPGVRPHMWSEPQQATIRQLADGSEFIKLESYMYAKPWQGNSIQATFWH